MRRCWSGCARLKGRQGDVCRQKSVVRPAVAFASGVHCLTTESPRYEVDRGRRIRSTSKATSTGDDSCKISGEHAAVEGWSHILTLCSEHSRKTSREDAAAVSLLTIWPRVDLARILQGCSGLIGCDSTTTVLRGNLTTCVRGIGLGEVRCDHRWEHADEEVDGVRSFK